MTIRSLIALFLFSIVSGASADDRPNILLIMTDDQGYADVGFNDSPDIITPELDKLAHNGVIFTSGYVVHPFCGPSRMGMLSGRYPHEFGGPYNLPPNRYGPNDLGIPVSEKLMSSTLQDAGYFTGLVGKWHLGDTPKYHPNVRGFDDFYGFLGGGKEYFPDEFHAKYDQQIASGNDNPWDYLHPLEHNGKEVRETEYVTDGLSREACRFIREASEKDQPFFLFLSYNAPHTPLQAKEEDMAMFPDITDQKRKTYAGMVYAVDRGVKQIVETLKAQGDFDNTLIVFLSDNGGRTDQGGNNAPLRGGKGSTFEGGFRVPMFMHWPAGLQSGKTYAHPVTALDLYPTFAGLANAEVPSDKELDGLDIMDAVKTGESPSDERIIYTVNHKAGYSDVGARMGDYKVVRFNHRPWLLYNVAEDPGENQNLRQRHPEKIEEIVGQMRELVQQHTEPGWFHAPEAGERWESENMPKYEKTFSTDLD